MWMDYANPGYLFDELLLYTVMVSVEHVECSRSFILSMGQGILHWEATEHLMLLKAHRQTMRSMNMPL